MSLAQDLTESLLQRDPVAWIQLKVQRNELNQPFRLFPHQVEVLRALFAFDADGKMRHDTLIYSCPKKSGKTSMLAILTLWWAMTQEPLNEVLLIANDLDQSQMRGFASIIKLLRHNPSIDPGAVIQSKEIRLSNETTIRAIASEYTSAAGANVGLTGWDELWGYTSERSRRLYEELTPVPTRQNSIRMITTYAGFTGESELLESLYLQAVAPEEHEQGQGVRVHPTLPIYANDAAKIVAYVDHEPRMPWQTETYLRGQQRQLRPNAFLRLHRNVWVSGISAFITEALWESNVDPLHRPLLPTRDVRVFVGVDGSVKHDSAAVVGVYWQGDRLALAFHRIWQPTPEEPLDIEETIAAELRRLHRAYQVASIRCDPYQLHKMIVDLAKEGLPIEEFPQTSGNLTRAGQALFDVLNGHNLTLYAAADLRAQALHTVSVESTRGWRLAKEKSSAKIDAMAALSSALVTAIEHGNVGPVSISPDEMEAIWREEAAHAAAAWAGGAEGVEYPPVRRRMGHRWMTR